MLDKFEEFDCSSETITNYELYLKPKGIYKFKELICDNYLYPVYKTNISNEIYYSTSVYALIVKRKKFIRNPNFQTTDFYRPTFQTIDKQVERVRTISMTSDKSIDDPNEIIVKSAEIFQEYITEIENKFSGYKHLLLMGGKDSQNYLLADRKEKWIVISGEPNGSLNKEFIRKNDIKNVEEIIILDDKSDDSMLKEELIASDCFFDMGHFKYIPKIHEITKRFNQKVVVWYGAGGDGKFKYCANHRFPNFYELHDLHVGMSMGILHQLTKNISNVPVLSIYQCSKFLSEVFYKFDPYYVKNLKSDIRIDIGKILFSNNVPIYPETNPNPSDWSSKKRNRYKSIDKYIDILEKENIKVSKKIVKSTYNKYLELIPFILNKYSSKKRSTISKILVPIRIFLSKYFKIFKINRYKLKEI